MRIDTHAVHVQYEEMYKQSIEDPSRFWGKIASEFHWERKWDTSKPICTYNFDIRKGPVHVEVNSTIT